MLIDLEETGDKFLSVSYSDMWRIDVARVVFFRGNQLYSGVVIRQDVLEAVFVSALWQLGDGAFPWRTALWDTLVFL